MYSRGGNASDLSQAPQATITTPTPTYIRTDLHEPVFLFETETDLLALGYLAARQPPTAYLREWETAGTAHDDTYGLLYARSDTGNGVADRDAFQSMLDPPSDPIPGIVDGAAPVNAGSHTYELRAAVAAANRWLTTGTAPLQVTPSRGGSAQPACLPDRSQRRSAGWDPDPPGAGTSGQAFGYRPTGFNPHRDPAEQLLHHLQCHVVQHPRHDGAIQHGPVLPPLIPTHASFVTRWDAATAVEVKQGYLLPADARTLDQVAATSTVEADVAGRWSSCPPGDASGSWAGVGAYSSPENRSHADCRVIPKDAPMAAHVAPSVLALLTKRARLLSTCAPAAAIREARQYSVEVEILFPRCQPWRQ